MCGELSQMYEQMSAPARATWQALIELNQITARSFKRVAEQEITFVGDCAETAARHLKMLHEMKGVQDVLMDEMRLATECGEKWMAGAHRVLEISLQAQSEFGQWMNDGLHRWHGQAQKAAEQVQQSLPQAA